MHDDERNVLLTRGRDWFHCGVCFNSLDIFSNMYLSEFYFFCFTAYFQATVQPRPQGFSLKKWVGPWGRGWPRCIRRWVINDALSTL